MIRCPLLLFFLLITVISAGQSRQKYIDSLQNEIATNTARDTSKAICLYRLCWELRKTDPVKSEQYGNEALQLSTELNFQKGIGASYNNLGGLYEATGDDVKALKYYTLALDAKRKSGDPKSIASTLNNIGIIYKKQEYYIRALTCYYEAMRINRDTDNKSFLVINYYNIANCHKGLNNDDSSLYYYRLTMDLAWEAGNYSAYTDAMYSMGNFYIEKGELEKGIAFLDSGHAVAVLQSVTSTEYYYFNGKGRGLFLINQPDSAEVYLQKAWDLKKNTRDWGSVNTVTDALAALYYNRYEQTGNVQFLDKAFQYQKISYAARDSLLNQQRMHTIFDLVTEDLMKQKNDEILAIQREKDIVDLKAENEKLFRNFLAALALAVVLVLVVLYARFRKNKMLARQLAQKNIQIESKNKEIIDSITYAKRLQEAILPPTEYIRQLFPESFVLYMPKDIVAGDFYWIESSGDKFFIASADCTGHGVPGALVSVVCANALDRSVNEFGIRETGKILDKTRELVTHTFDKSAEMVNDGMDISLLALSLNPASPGKVQWSGANNPLWMIRKGIITEVKPDKQPVGRFEHAKPFSAHELEFQKGDWLYIFTDGYADQFGGEQKASDDNPSGQGKKFKYAQLKTLLIRLSELPADEQRAQLEKTILDWRGDLEQVDDICIVGVRL